MSRVSSSTQFLDLVEDVILHVLGICGILGAVSSSQTCRRLHALVFNKHVWLALLQDLDARMFLDMPPGQSLRDLSVAELIDLAKRTVQGPETWAHHSCQVVLHPDIPTGEGISHWENEAKLLPGGKWILFNNWHTLECWNVPDNKLIWRYRSQREDADLKDFSAEVVYGGQAVVIFLGQSIYDQPHESCTNFVEIVHLDLELGTSRLLLSYTLDTEDENAFLGSTICGDLVAASIQGPARLLLLNWRSSLCLLLKTSQTVNAFCGSDIALIPGYVLVAAPDISQSRTSLFVWSTDSFKARWSPTDPAQLSHSVSIEDIPRLGTYTIDPHVPEGSSKIRLSAHESPLREGSYIVWVWTSHPADSTLWKFSLSLPSQCEQSLRVQRSTSVIKDIGVDYTISYAGYCAFWTRVIDCRGEVGNKVELELPDCGNYIHLSAYSGSVTYSTRSSIVIHYYK